MERLLEYVRLHWRGYLAAVAAVALVSGVIGLVFAQVRIANLSMLYLTAVLAVAVAFGSGPAVLASVLAFLTFDFFFVTPRYTFTVADPEEWISLLLFLLIAIITGQLAADQRRRAQEARQREREAVVLYDVARIMSEPDLDQALSAVAERLRRELQLPALAIEVESGAGAVARAVAGDGPALEAVRSALLAPSRLLSEGRNPTADRPGAPGRWIRVIPPRLAGAPRDGLAEHISIAPVRAQGRRVGSLLLVHPHASSAFDAAEDRLLSAVATQLGLAVERAQLRREATEAEVLRRTDELRSALLNSVSHDLRTPLAAIKASAESLLQTDVPWSDEDRAGFAAAINREADRLNRLVGNLLDMSRIEAGALRLQRDWYDVGELIREVIGRLGPALYGRDVELAIEDGLPPVPLDYLLIDQVVTNLIENGAKYTPPGSPIRVSVERAPGHVRVVVADRGPGIPADQRERIFDKFFRLGQTPGVRGSGLGLALSRGLVEAHGGQIWVEDNPGGGARFVFELPLQPPPGRTARSELSSASPGSIP